MEIEDMDEIILDAILEAGGMIEMRELGIAFGARQAGSSLRNLMSEGLVEFSPCGRVYAIVPGSSEVTEFSSIFNATLSPSRAA